MGTRKFEDLVLKNETAIFYGDIEISRHFDIQNSTLIVSGALILSDTCINISLKGSDISAERIKLGTKTDEILVLAENTDIFANNLSTSFIVFTDGNIYVKNDLRATNLIYCSNLIVDGYAVTKSIVATEDVTFGADCNCQLLSARDVYVNGRLNLNGYPLNNCGKTFVRDGIINRGDTSK